MPLESVARIPECAECEAVWLSVDEARWRASLGVDELDDELPEVGFYRPQCAEHEFG